MQRWLTTQDQINAAGECKVFGMNGRDVWSVSFADKSRLVPARGAIIPKLYKKILCQIL
jgi:hypothetical protein